MNIAEKLHSLHYCIAHGYDEDICGHLCDLLVHYGKKITPSDPRVPKCETTVDLAKRYGSDPHPIEET